MWADRAIQQMGETLLRAHALFGASGPMGVGPGEALREAADRAIRGATAGLRGRLAAEQDAFANGSRRRLGALSDADDRLGSSLRAAADADHRGHAASGEVVTRAGVDAAREAGATTTPAGRRALLAALRARVAEQRRIVGTARLRDARLAELLRVLTAQGGRGGFGGTGGGPARLPGTAAFGSSAGVPGLQVPSELAPVGRLTRDSSRRQCAAVLVREALRRGYSPSQAVAMVSTMLQESDGNPRAASPNGLWRSLFQQDASYAGRDDPNAAISGFLDRLATKGGPSSPDIWKSIFWLQQASGAPSAEAAYAGGRRGYLREIQSQLGRAEALYWEVVGGGWLRLS